MYKIYYIDMCVVSSLLLLFAAWCVVFRVWPVCIACSMLCGAGCALRVAHGAFVVCCLWAVVWFVG